MAKRWTIFFLVFAMFEISETVLNLSQKVADLKTKTIYLEKAIDVVEYKHTQKINELENQIADLSSLSREGVIENLTAAFEARVEELEIQLGQERSQHQELRNRYENTRRDLANMYVQHADEKFFRKSVETSLNRVVVSEGERRENYEETIRHLQSSLADVQKRASELSENLTLATLQMTEANQRYNVFISQIEIKMEDMVKSTLAIKNIRRDFFHPPKDCTALYVDGVRDDGIYSVNPDITTGGAFEVYCDMTAGGWTTIQRRSSRAVKFYEPWVSYANGFGRLTDDHWLGLNNIHRLTSAPSEIQITVSDYDGNVWYIAFQNFTVSDESDNFRLQFSPQSKDSNFTYEDEFIYHNNLPFSTYDRDNDRMASSCAKSRGGGWWYLNCYRFNLNGKYGTKAIDGIASWNVENGYTFYKNTVMKIRSL